MFKRATSYAGHILVVAALTLLTQVGGLAYLGALAVRPRLRFRNARQRSGVTLALAAILYAVLTLFVVPLVAPLAGRIRIPCDMTTAVSCALNRNYARPALAGMVNRLNLALSESYPGSRITILDASFPFLDGFPLLPHLSHDDGNKVDLAFFYSDAERGEAIPSGSPSPIGYFHFQQPRAGEVRPCTGRSHPLRWDFAWAQPDVPAWRLDEERTGAMIRWLKAQPLVTRIFLEPHLATRLGVAGGKVRFQGCAAARHDDHVHVQIG